MTRARDSDQGEGISKGWKWLIGLEAIAIVVLALMLWTQMRDASLEASTTTTTDMTAAVAAIKEGDALITGDSSQQSQALEDYDHALQVAPGGSSSMLYQEAEALHNQKDFVLAASVMHLVVKYQPERAEYWLQYADGELAIGDAAEALYAYSRCRDILSQQSFAPDSPEARRYGEALDGIKACTDKLTGTTGAS